MISRVSSKGSCKRCVHRIVAKGEDNLSTTHPELLKEWDFEKNTLYSPEELSRGSDQRVFWLCSAGHSFEASISSRSGRGRGCSICAGQKVLAGFNDLATTHPEIAAEWDHESNNPLSPSGVSKGSNRRVSWICHRGHSYRARIADRTAGKGCSICANKIIITGVNDLATTHPEIAAEWNHELNSPLKPSMISHGTVKKVWWKCSIGHNYEALVSSRSFQKSGCAICAGKKILVGFNDLATTHPEIAAEWDYEKNSPLLPSQIPGGTGKSVYWLCPEGHSYRSIVGSRTNIGTGCPKCNLGGFDSTQAGLFYLLKSVSLKARKVGITNPARRYDRIAAYGIEWEVIHTITNSDGQIIRDLETSVLRWIRKEVGLPQYLGKEEMGQAGGHSETFGIDGISDGELLAKIEEIYQRLLG